MSCPVAGALCLIDRDARHGSLAACAHGRASAGRLAVIGALAVVFSLSSLQTTPRSLAVITSSAGVAAYAILLRYLPFYKLQTNMLQGAGCGMYLWACACMFIGIMRGVPEV